MYPYYLCNTSLSAQQTITGSQRNHFKTIDSLEQVLATNPPTGQDLLRIYRSLAWGNLGYDNQKVKSYSLKGIPLAQQLNFPLVEAFFHQWLGITCYHESLYDSAMVCYNKALIAAERMKTSKGSSGKPYPVKDVDDKFASIYGDMGNLYNVQEKFHEAIEYYTKALKIFEKHGWKESVAVAYENIGEMYLAMDNYEQADINFTKLYAIGQEVGDSLIIMYADKKLSVLYLIQKNYDKALEKAEAVRRYIFVHPEEGENEKAFVFNLFAQIYLEGYNDMGKAETYVKQALQINDSTGIDPREKSNSLALLSSIHLKRNEWRKAEQTALEALATDNTAPANTLSLYENLAKAYAHLGNAAKADEYFDKHNELQASWSNKHYQSAIREMETKYETEKKETKIAALEDEKQLMIWLGIAGGAVLLLALAAFFFLWRWTVQKKRLAESQKELADRQIKQLEQEKQLIATQAVLDGEVQERIRLARDLHDGLGSMLASVKINLQNARQEITGESKYYSLTINLLDDSMKELRRIAHHLMPELLMRCGLKTSLETFCQSMPATQFHYFGEDTRFDGKLETLLYRSAHELIYNAIKHAGASQTNVQLIQESERISLTVQDNGKGFDPSQETGGMGLNNIRQRVAVFNGEFSISSEPGQGTEINMEFQLKIEN